MSYNELTALAMRNCNNDPDTAKVFIKGFLKQAFMQTPGGALSTEAGKMMGKALSGVLVGAGAFAAAKMAKGIGNTALHSKFLQALSQAIQTSPILKNADHDKVVQYAETVFKFAPHVAGDPNLLTSILTNAIHGDGVDPATVKMIGELEGRYQDNTAYVQAFSPKTYL